MGSDTDHHLRHDGQRPSQLSPEGFLYAAISRFATDYDGTLAHHGAIDDAMSTRSSAFAPQGASSFS
jgi:hypothetical protein